MSRTRVVLLVVVLAAAAAGGVFYALLPPTYAVVTPARGDAADIVYATGVVEPQTWAKVSALVRDRIVEMCDCEGEHVGRSKVLARLDDSEERATLAELQARMELAESELERLARLSAQNFASIQDADRAQSEVDQIDALIAGQQAKLDSLVLRSPTDGIVLREDGEVGEIAETGAVLFWVGEEKPLIVTAEVNEEDIPRVETGQRVLLRADAFPDRVLEARVGAITPKGDPVTKTYRVRFILPDDTPLRIGMTVDVNVVVGVAENALLVPAAAVDGSAAYVVEAGETARRRALEIGIRGETSTEVKAGLSEGDRVISPYPEGLDDGTRIRILGS